MKTELVDVSPTRKEIKIEIDLGTIRGAYDRISDSLREAGKRARLSSGHAPRGVVARVSRTRFAPRRCRSWCPRRLTKRLYNMSSTPLAKPDVQLDNTEALEKFGQKRRFLVKVNV